jgi:hypothetical protein
MKSYYEIDEEHIYLAGLSGERRTESGWTKKFPFVQEAL